MAEGSSPCGRRSRSSPRRRRALATYACIAGARLRDAHVDEMWNPDPRGGGDARANRCEVDPLELQRLGRIGMRRADQMDERVAGTKLRQRRRRPRRASPGTVAVPGSFAADEGRTSVRTAWPRAASSAIRRWPMYPVPPVTKTFTSVSRVASYDRSTPRAIGNVPICDGPVRGPRTMLSATHAARFADIALANVVREYPGKPDHVLGGDADLLPPRMLHPAFYGSYDWHSCVHMHWLLVHVRRLHPELPQRADIDALLDRHLALDAIAAECAYLRRPEARAFERPYGWTWLLKLARRARAFGRRRRAPLGGPARAARARVRRPLSRDGCRRPTIRSATGCIPNSAFGLLFALDYARHAGEAALAAAIEAKARAWFGDDRDAPVAWEPSGFDFLSPALVEAELMRRVLDADAFGALARRFPARDAAACAHDAVRTGRGQRSRRPAHRPSRRPQPVARVVLSRHRFGAAGADPRATAAREAAAAHLAAGLAGLDSDDYVGSHWLASFAALALSEP